MFRPSITIPEPIQSQFDGELEHQNVARIPVAIRPECPHLFYNTSLAPVFQTHLTADGLYQRRLVGGQARYDNVPGPGGLCWLIFPDSDQRFFGKVQGVAEYQETRLILLVAHVASPATVSLAVPYEWYDGVDESRTRWATFVSWLCQKPARLPDDSHRPIRGRC